ncbi:MAG TPA: RagB/SusD family nutrient uptake outer membrane protein, partial [Chitinophaga sp.]|nr:RagB/SusD family nutrient uptake outer membrane protein [Chitinophaga sp.]
MKKLIFPYIWLITGLALFSCKKSLDLKPLNEISDADYWKNADQFKLAANECYTFMASFNTVLYDGGEGANPGPAPHSDLRSDLITSGSRNVFSNGSNTIPLTDKRWDTAYSRIRTTNYLLAQAAKYSSPAEISKYVAEAKFFRAYVYFDLLQLYGGVPLIDKLLNVNSPELQAPRNTRDEIVDFIITDLNAAIPDLPIEAVITAADKGRISKGAAQAFLSRVALYEGTWQKFRGNTARANALLDTAIFRSNEVINSNQYTLFGTSGASASLG